MHVSSLGFSNQFVEHIQTLQRKQLNCMRAISAGRTCHKASDSPAVAASVLKAQVDQSKCLQFQKNISCAKSTLESASSCIERIYQLNVEISTLSMQFSKLNETTFPIMRSELDNLIEQCVQEANACCLDRFLFSGNKLSTTPFEVERDGEGKIIKVTYRGSEGANVSQIGIGIAVNPSTEPEENKAILTVLQNLVELRNVCAQPTIDEDHVRLINQKLMHNNENALIEITGSLGVKLSNVNYIEQRNDLLTEGLQATVAEETEADVATFMVQLTQAQASYQAALKTASKVLDISLLNFL